jgi:transketolase
VRFSPSELPLSHICLVRAGSSVEKSLQGGYTVHEQVTAGAQLPHPTLVLVSTGTEVALALQVAKNLFEASTAAGNR